MARRQEVTLEEAQERIAVEGDRKWAADQVDGMAEVATEGRKPQMFAAVVAEIIGRYPNAAPKRERKAKATADSKPAKSRAKKDA